MALSSPKGVTQLLVDWNHGNKDALDQLMPIIYQELRRMASRYLRKERRDHTLQTTALVNEAYLRLVDYSNLRWQARAKNCALAAQLMRNILIDHTRSHQYAKRGMGAQKVSLDDALTSLATIDPRKSQVVELRYFGGLSGRRRPRCWASQLIRSREI